MEPEESVKGKSETGEHQAEAYAKLANSYVQKQQWQPAITSYRRAIELNPNSSWFHHHLGDVLTKQHQWREAVSVYYRAIELNPQFSWSYHNLGNALVQLQRWEEAVKAYRKAIELEPKFHWSYCNLGDAFLHLKKWEEAVFSYLKTLELLEQSSQGEDKPLITGKLGEALENQAQGNLNQAINRYRQFAQNPELNEYYRTSFVFIQEKPEFIIDLVDFLSKKNKINATIILLSIIQELDPVNLEAKLKLNQVLQKKRKLDQAIAQRRQKIDQQPEQWFPYESGLVTNSEQVLEEIASSSTFYLRNSQLTFSTDSNVNLDELEKLFKAVGWPFRSRTRMQMALQHSFLVVSLWKSTENKQHLIGFTRAVSDQVFNATLWDVAIHPDCQGQGLGKAMMQYTLEKLRHANIDNITLFAGSQAVNFYHNLGFVSDPHGVKGMFWFPD